MPQYPRPRFSQPMLCVHQPQRLLMTITGKFSMLEILPICPSVGKRPLSFVCEVCNLLNIWAQVGGPMDPGSQKGAPKADFLTLESGWEDQGWSGQCRGQVSWVRLGPVRVLIVQMSAHFNPDDGCGQTRLSRLSHFLPSKSILVPYKGTIFK